MLLHRRVVAWFQYMLSTRLPVHEVPEATTSMPHALDRIDHHLGETLMKDGALLFRDSSSALPFTRAELLPLLSQHKTMHCMLLKIGGGEVEHKEKHKCVHVVDPICDMPIVLSACEDRFCSVCSSCGEEDYMKQRLTPHLPVVLLELVLSYLPVDSATPPVAHDVPFGLLTSPSPACQHGHHSYGEQQLCNFMHQLLWPVPVVRHYLQEHEAIDSRTHDSNIFDFFRLDLAPLTEDEKALENERVARKTGFFARASAIPDEDFTLGGGISTPITYLGVPGVPFCWHGEDACLSSVNVIKKLRLSDDDAGVASASASVASETAQEEKVASSFSTASAVTTDNHAGLAKIWFFCPSANETLFWSMLGEHLGIADDSVCLSKSVFWLPTIEQAKQLGMRMILQHRGEGVITAPFAVHSGLNVSANEAESLNMMLRSTIPAYVENDLGKFAERINGITETHWLGAPDLGVVAGAKRAIAASYRACMRPLKPARYMHSRAPLEVLGKRKVATGHSEGAHSLSLSNNVGRMMGGNPTRASRSSKKYKVELHAT